MTQDNFDHHMFLEMKTLMKDKFAMVLDEYNEDAQSYIHRIKSAMGHSDVETVAACAHPLKSSSMALGFIGLGTIAKDIEETAKGIIHTQDQDLNQLRTRVDDLDAGYEFVTQQIAAHKTA